MEKMEKKILNNKKKKILFKNFKETIKTIENFKVKSMRIKIFK